MRRRLWLTALSLTAASLAPAGAADPSPDLNYLETRRVEHVDTYHGVEVPDPYRWLEQDVRESEDVAKWVEAQNKITFGYLETIPERSAIEARLTDLWNYEKYGSPFKAGGRYYFYKNDGLQNQFVLYVQETLDDEPQVLIDPNEWSKDGTVALSGTSFSDLGRYVAYGVAEAGSDWRTWRVMEIESRKVLPDELHWIKWGGASWTKDGKGFFYSRFDEPKEGEEFQGLNLNHQVFYHRVGTPQEQDVLVYKRPDEPEWGFTPEVSEDGRYLIITVSKGTDERYRILYRDLTEPYAMPIELIDNFENEYSFIGNDGSVFYFKTDVDAPKRRIVAIDIRRPQREPWREIVPESEHVLTEVDFVANLFVCHYL
ncbi:MAG: S9 family peptidase, partial [Planctomycetaceae bacterium]